MAHFNKQQTRQALKQFGKESLQVAKLVHQEKPIQQLAKATKNKKLTHKQKETIASIVTLIALVIGLMFGCFWVIFH